MNPLAVIIDDEEAVCWALARALRAEGFDAEIASSAEAGLKLVGTRVPDVVFLDVRLPRMDGITALARLREQYPDLPVIVMTAYGDLATAVGAVQGGAFDYMTKPFDLGRAIQLAELARQRHVSAPRPVQDAAPLDDEMVGETPVMQQVFKSIALAAAEPVCVLVTGESGTGKELVARALHRHSRRAGGPFLPVHAAALSPSLVESELFGHVRGAFTGADAARTGLLALAHGGTIFLDEVAEIPPAVQVKLLRALESGEVLPVGADMPTRHDFRIIAATNRDLARLVAEGKFREDLLFRLNVFRIHLPPLRDRIDDIPSLVSYFLSKFAPDSKPVPADTIRHLQQLDWPGNVRQLRNAVQRAAILARGSAIRPEHFEVSQHGDEAPTGDLAGPVLRWIRARLAAEPTATNLAGELLQAVEPTLFREVMRRARGNRSTAAEWLGLDRATVRKKLQAYGLEEAGQSPTEN